MTESTGQPNRRNLVSCQSLQVFLRYVQSRGMDDGVLLEGLPYSSAHLRDPDERVGYDTFRTVARRFSALFPDEPEAAYQAGLSVPELRSLGYIVLLLAMRLDPALVFSLTPKMVQRQFPMIQVRYARTGATRCRLTYRHPPSCAPFPEFVAVARGLMAATPTMAGLPPAEVRHSPTPDGFELDVSWPGAGRLGARIRAATFGRFTSLRGLMTEMEAAKDRVERELQETERASRRLAALLAVGRAVERGLDVGALIDSFSRVAERELAVRLLHLHLSGLAKDDDWTGVAEALSDLHEPVSKPIALPGRLGLPLRNGETVHAVPVESQEGRLGLAFLSAGDDLSLRPQVERELLADAFNRLGQALDNALRHRELSTYGERLEQRVAQRTAELAAQTACLQETNDKLVALDRAKRRFFTHLSHELRTPTTLLSASLEQIERHVPQGDPDLARAVDRARRNIARVVYAVDDLLDLALLNEAKMQAVPEELDAGDLVRTLRQAVEPWAESHQVRVDARVQHDATFFGDRRLLEKALLNLVVNAIKFSPPGALVEVVAEPAPKGVTFRVRDQGPGVSAEDRERIFEAFQQAGHQGLQQGIGIGLSLVRSVADLHGGSVAYAPRDGGGSEFCLFVPTGEANDPCGERTGPSRRQEGSARHRAAALLGGATPAKANPPSVPARARSVWGGHERPHVLVVDDEPDIVDVLQESLRSTYQVTTAASGAEALALVDTDVPAAVLADVSMPGMSGFDLCRRLRERAETRHVPIVLLTALGSVEDKLRGFEVGADDYVTKPFSLKEVEARLRTHIALRRMAAETNALTGASLMGTVAAGIMHEVNNPLNVLLNALPPIAESVRGAQDEATARAMLELAEDSARRIHTCVSSFASISSWSDAEPETVDLGSFVDAVIASNRGRGGGSTRIERNGTVIRPVGLVRTHAALVIGNLLTNAVDAAGPDGHVVVELADDADHVTVTIRDDGPGMDATTLRKVREPFFTTKEPGKGMGLGLFVVHQLLRHLQGRLEFESEAGRGTTATVVLPIAPAIP